MDWELGGYEHIAVGLRPAAAVLVAEAAPVAGERVLDIGCGTGNVALLAARAGAIVTGVDPAPRLLEVARRRASAAALEARFVRGEAAALPCSDGTVDVLTSAFGVIFAPDADAAAAEIARVVAPRGRVVIAAWKPVGAMPAVQAVRRRALGELDDTAAPPPFRWHDGEALAELFAPHGFVVNAREEVLALEASSAGAFFDSELRNHPVWVASRSALEAAGSLDAVRGEAVAIFAAANENPDGFRLSWPYTLASARRA